MVITVTGQVPAQPTQVSIHSQVRVRSGQGQYQARAQNTENRPGQAQASGQARLARSGSTGPGQVNSNSK
jgi:hypothetical protein